MLITPINRKTEYPETIGTAGNEFSIEINIIKELPSSTAATIPFGDSYLIFIGIAITALILIERKKKNQNQF